MYTKDIAWNYPQDACLWRIEEFAVFIKAPSPRHIHYAHANTPQFKKHPKLQTLLVPSICGKDYPDYITMDSFLNLLIWKVEVENCGLLAPLFTKARARWDRSWEPETQPGSVRWVSGTKLPKPLSESLQSVSPSFSVLLLRTWFEWNMQTDLVNGVWGTLRTT